MIDNDGVRAPDEARMQVLSGPDPYADDYDPVFEAQVQADMRRMERQRLEQQRMINDGIVGGIRTGMSNTANAMASGIGSMFGYSSSTNS